MLEFVFEINLPNGSDLIEQFGLEPYGRIQEAVDKAIVKYSEPYTPMDTGRTRDSVDASIGSGVLYYPGPYAHYIWEGVSKNGKPLIYQKKNPHAGPHWVERAMADHLQDVCREAEKELRNG